MQTAIPLDFARILDTLGDPVVAADSSGRVVYANGAIEVLLGWPPGTLLGQPLTVLIPERLRGAHTAGFNRFIETGKPSIIGHPMHVPALSRYGTEIDIELTLSALTAPDESRLVVASLHDLSERVELERQMAITTQLRSVTRTAAEITSLLDLDAVLNRVVESLTSNFGAALARIWLFDSGRNQLRLEAESGSVADSGKSAPWVIDVATYPYKVAEAARRRMPFIKNGLLGDPQFDQEWVQRDGIAGSAVFPLVYGQELLGVLASFSRTPLPPETIEALATVAAITTAAIHDVRILRQEQQFRTQAVEAEARSAFLAAAGDVLSSSLDYETTLANVAHLAVGQLADWCLVDVVEREGRLQRVALEHRNPEAASIVEELGRRYPADEEHPPAALRVIETGEPVLVPEITPELLRPTARDEEHFELICRLDPLSYMCVPLKIQDRTLGALTLMTSTSSGRRFGTADLTLTEELARRAAVAVDNARLYGELQESIRVRDEFLSSISHDLKNPLATIKARAQLLRRRAGKLSGEDAQRIVDGLESIDLTASKMSRLINDLVDLVHLRIGRPLTLRREETDLARLVREVAEDQQTTQNRTVRVEVRDEPLEAYVDSVRIERVLVNLLSNAIKYSPEGGEVTVTVERGVGPDGDTGVIAVRDQGIGIPADELPSVFERFFRASNATNYAGTGIGLAGALQIVEQHGGTIAVASEEGKGTTFTVRLPLAPPDS